MKKVLSCLLVVIMGISPISQNLFTVDAHAAARTAITYICLNTDATDNTVSTYVDINKSEPNITINNEQSKANLGWIWIIMGVALIGLAAVVAYIITEDRKKDIPTDENNKE